ncbi:MAG: class I SAM-dependent methyltransferase [Alphaproteobacteria bacterium]|nr:class I SAM-dependent methyltransferase [Alphaproteobacteria bacterium]
MLETRLLPPNVEYEEVACDLCGSDDLVVWAKARGNSLSRCRQCGLVFTNPRIKHASDKDRLLYSSSYFSQKSRMTQKLIAARQTSYLAEIKSLERLKAGGKILDVGCGMGLFLHCFDKTWEKYGCDVSSFAVEEAGRRGIRAFHGEFEALDFADQRFDVIYFRASLQHVYSPRACLDKACRLLNSKGVVAITMSPNADGLCGRLFRGHVRSYEQPHNYMFSPTTLGRYLKSTGFEILETSQPYFGTGYESWRDFVDLPISYAKYLWLAATDRRSVPGTFDFASPPFYGNYVNILGKKVPDAV